MVYASTARNMVRDGKPRMAARPPIVLDHYQSLPPPRRLHTDMKPIDYIGLYIIVTAASCVTVNWLYRIYL